jgi:hypothetical protein
VAQAVPAVQGPADGQRDASGHVNGATLVIPAHVDGWAHFSEGIDEFVAAFDQAGISGVLGVAAHGEWIDWIAPSTR